MDKILSLQLLDQGPDTEACISRQSCISWISHLPHVDGGANQGAQGGSW